MAEITERVCGILGLDPSRTLSVTIRFESKSAVTVDAELSPDREQIEALAQAAMSDDADRTSHLKHPPPTANRARAREGLDRVPDFSDPIRPPPPPPRSPTGYEGKTFRESLRGLFKVTKGPHRCAECGISRPDPKSECPVCLALNDARVRSQRATIQASYGVTPPPPEEPTGAKVLRELEELQARVRELRRGGPEVGAPPPPPPPPPPLRRVCDCGRVPPDKCLTCRLFG